MLTLEEIAALAGVSRATVSRVVNDDPHVSPATRQRVQRVIREQGYQPNAAARALVQRRSQTISFVVHEALGYVFSDPYFPLLLQGVAMACEERGYHLMLSPLAAQTPEAYSRVLRGGRVDGLVVGTAKVGDAFLQRLEAEGVPFVLVGTHPSRPHLPHVASDCALGGRLVAEHLLALGYRRPATITGPAWLGGATERRDGFLRALRERGSPCPASRVVESDDTERGGYEAMTSLLSGRDKPDAVFAGNDLMAIGALRAAREAGVRIPEDIGLVGFDDVPMASMVQPPLTTVRQPIVALGMAATGLLVETLKGLDSADGSVGAQVRTLPVQLVVRASCGQVLRGGIVPAPQAEPPLTGT